MKAALRISLLLAVSGLSLFCKIAFSADGYIGSKVCQTCHQSQYDLWQQSHHKQAMLPATKGNVLGDFDSAEFQYRSLKHTFSHKAGKYFVTTDNAKGQLQTFEIIYTFGFEPLQQYLIKMDDGRLQALSISWDNRPEAQGGQRWYHLYPNQDIQAGDGLHWTGHYQNWNSRCAHCHSTNLQKNYDIKTNRFDTRFSEVNVACEACHGPGEEHLKWTKVKKGADKKILALKNSARWQFAPGKSIAHRVDSDPVNQSHISDQINTCAACHSLRSELAEHQPDKAFNDQYMLRLLEPPYYQADGQINEEVYVYGSFLQSKMYQAGVVCSDCHDSHSGQIKGDTSTVCMQCHKGEVYSQLSHHQHTPGTAGSFCVDCHMPEKTYMGVDKRRDHSFRIPHPELSEAQGTSNACVDCHKAKTNQWASAARQKWPNKKLFSKGLDVKYTEILADSRIGRPSALQPLIALINNPQQASIKRATALLNLASFPSREAFSASMAILQSEDPLLRAAAIRSLAYVPVNKRRGFVSLINDPSKNVRMELAPYLAAMPRNDIPEPIVTMLKELFAEYIQMQQSQADMPSAQLSLGNFYLSLRAAEDAQKAFKQALVIVPDFVPALLNLADFYRLYGDEKMASQYLTQAIARADDSAAAAHAMGLFKIRQKKNAEALRYLAKAVKLEAANTRYRYVYAVALSSADKLAQALSEIKTGLKRAPYNPDLLRLIVSLLEKNGRVMEASTYRQRLVN